MKTLMSVAIAVMIVASGQVFGLAPASASETAQDCWVDLGTRQSLCVSTSTDIYEAVFDRYGVEVFTENEKGEPISTLTGETAAIRSAPGTRGADAALASYTLVTFYRDANKTGPAISYTLSDFTACSDPGGWGVANLASSGFNNTISSFQTYWGCAAKIWDGTSWSGDSFGWSVNANSVGSMNDRASSFKLD